MFTMMDFLLYEIVDSEAEAQIVIIYLIYNCKFVIVSGSLEQRHSG